MTVYVLEIGSYDDRGVHGVFASVEAAKTAYPAVWERYGTDGWATEDINQAHESGFIQPYEVED